MLRPLEIVTSSNPVDAGWCAVRTRSFCRRACAWWGSENSREDATGLAWEVTVKVYGVAVTMPQG